MSLLVYVGSICTAGWKYMFSKMLVSGSVQSRLMFLWIFCAEKVHIGLFEVKNKPTCATHWYVVVGLCWFDLYCWLEIHVF